LILGPPQIRRVPLSRIWLHGQVSYQALREITIKYAFPTSSFDPNDFECALTYYDVDNDLVTIASTEELIDAIEQFSSMEKPVLKISTMVVKRGNTINSCGREKVENSFSDVKEHKVQDLISDTNEDKPRQLQGLVDSCVSVVIGAVGNLKTTIAEVDSTHSASTSKGSDNPLMNKGCVFNNQKDEVKLHNVKPPFIHGRHTCDACYKTPIVGLRYHSTNFPDYDLCADCRHNYKGSEILFEAVELDCDRRFQGKWRRKHFRLSGCDQNSLIGFDLISKTCRKMKQRILAHDDNEMDPSLDEAIRRSLEDMKDKTQIFSDVSPKVKSIIDGSFDGVTEDTNTCLDEATLPKVVQLYEETEEPDNIANSELKVSNLSLKDAIENSSPSKNCTELDTDTSFSSEATGHCEVAHSIGNALDEFANAITEVVTEIDRQHSTVDELLRDADDKSTNQSEGLEDEWQVVNEDHDPINEDSMAQATYLIGSTLFESDLRSSAVDESSSLVGSFGGGSDLLSDFSSLPTPESNGTMSKVLYDRWSPQLQELHELGFMDDDKNVETLERLKAAYIGVDSDEEACLSQVVNALLN